VFLLDDHEIVRRGVRELIETDGDLEVVGEAGTVEEAWPASRRPDPTSRCSTRACPMAAASRCVERSATGTLRSRA
jgi:hypothetical protein